MSPTQIEPRPDQQQQQQHAQRQRAEAGAEAMQRTPAAVRDWSDDETEASEPPAADLFISDSESDGGGDLAPAPAPQQSQEQAAARSLPPKQQPRLLLQVSRPSAAGHATTGSRSPAAVAATHSRQSAGMAAATPAASLGDCDEPMSSPGGDWEAPPPATGSDDAVQRAAADGGPSLGQPPAAAPPRPGSSSLVGAVNERFVTSRRPVAVAGGGDRQQQQSVRDWSEDDVSSGDDVPMPKGGWSARPWGVHSEGSLYCRPSGTLLGNCLPLRALPTDLPSRPVPCRPPPAGRRRGDGAHAAGPGIDSCRAPQAPWQRVGVSATETEHGC